MINAKFIQKDEKIISFSLSGHAESGPAGHDLVCAAASALSIGATNNLERIASIQPDIKAKEDAGGFLEVTLPSVLNEKQKEQGEILLRSLYYSLLDIEKEYGEFVSVSLTKKS